MKRGPKPKGKVPLKWSGNFAYAIGLLVADGCLSKDGRHIDFTSKDDALVNLFQECLGISIKTSKKYSGAGNLSYHAQFSDVLFYKFLLNIGLSPAKSLTLGAVEIPDKYFIDYLRGYFDGDGSSYSYFDPKFKKSFRFYISFTSGSRTYIDWFRAELHRKMGVKGYISHNHNNAYIQLKYAKKEAMLIVKKMYDSEAIPFLERKRQKITESMKIIESSRGGEIGRRAAFRAQ